MKKLIVVLGLFAMFGFQTARADEGADLINEAHSLGDQFKVLQADRAKMIQRQSDLNWAAEQLKPKFDQFQADRANLNQQMEAHQGVINNHNSRCSGTFDDPGYVNSCNAEANQIDADSAQLNGQSASLEQTRALLIENAQVHDDEQAKVAAQDENDRQQMIQISTRYDQIIVRLKEIQASNNDCKAAIAAVDANPESDGAKEHMHAVCGSMFDGNK